MNCYPFSALLSRMRYINRWGLMRATRQENLAEHTAETAVFPRAKPTSAPPGPSPAAFDAGNRLQRGGKAPGRPNEGVRQ